MLRWYALPPSAASSPVGIAPPASDHINARATSSGFAVNGSSRSGGCGMPAALAVPTHCDWSMQMRFLSAAATSGSRLPCASAFRRKISTVSDVRSVKLRSGWTTAPTFERIAASSTPPAGADGADGDDTFTKIGVIGASVMRERSRAHGASAMGRACLR